MSLTRVPTYMTRSILVDRMNQVQQRLNTVQTQVTTEKKSQNYTGISEDAYRLINFESQTTRVRQFINNNTVASTRFETVTNSLNATESTLRDMRKQLGTFMQRDPNGWDQQDTNDLNQLQSSAFAALKDLEYYLNVDVDGHHLFGGGKSERSPVSMGASDLTSFQAIYDGEDITFPESRAAVLSNLKSTPEGAKADAYTSYVSGSAQQTVAATDHGGITYTAGNPGTLTAGTAGAFTNFRAGDLVSVEDPDNPDNSGVFTVTAATANSLTVNGNAATATTSLNVEVKRLVADPIEPGDYDGLTFTAGPPLQLADVPGGNQPFTDLTVGDKVKIGDGTGLRGTYTIATKPDDDTITLTKDSGDDLAGMDVTALRISLPVTEDFGTLTFDGSPNAEGDRVVGTLTSSVAGYFDAYEVGMSLTVNGTATDIYGESTVASQDATYTIVGVSTDGKSLQVEPSFPAAGGSGGSNYGPLSFSPDDFNIALTANRTHGDLDHSTYLSNGNVTTTGTTGTDYLEVGVNLGPTAGGGTGDLVAGDKVTIVDGAGRVFRHLVVAADPNSSEIQLYEPDGTTAFDNSNFTEPSGYKIIKESTETPAFVTGELDDSNFGTLTLDATAGTIAAGANGAFSGLSRGMTILFDDGQNHPSANFDGIYTITDVSTDFRTLTVDPPPTADGTITNGTGAVMRIGVPEGTRIQVDGSTSNDNYYTVTWPSDMTPDDTAAAIAGQKIFTREAMTTEASLPAGVSVTATSYYRGDNLTVTHRADKGRDVELSVNASDPAFDKAVRALGILAQGMPRRSDGTPDPHELQRRLDKAMALLGDAIEHPVDSKEAPSDLNVLQQRLGYAQHAIKEASEQQTSLLSFLEARVTEMENVDMFKAVTEMQDEMRALEVSYQTFSRISQLSLAKYL